MWTKEPERFRLNPIHQSPGLNNYETGLPIASKLTGYVHTDYKFTAGYSEGRGSTAEFDPLNDFQDATHMLDLRLGVRRNGIDISLFVNNVLDSTDRLYVEHATNISGLFKEVTFRPRTFGLTLSGRY